MKSRAPQFAEVRVHRVLEDAIRDNHKLVSYVSRLRFVLMDNPGKRAMYAKLCAEPEIQEVLKRQAARRDED
jgi:hypothetical protein